MPQPSNNPRPDVTGEERQREQARTGGTFSGSESYKQTHGQAGEHRESESRPVLDDAEQRANRAADDEGDEDE